MAKTKFKIAQEKSSEPERGGNRYLRASRVIAKAGGTIDVATLADRAFMSEGTAKRCLEAWSAVVQALTEAGRLSAPKAPKAPKAERDKKVVDALPPGPISGRNAG
jgi:hypothetical protein